MSRTFSGQTHLEAARKLRDQAQSVDQFRQAMAVLLPLECGLTLQQVAAVLGRSKGAVCTLRTRFITQPQELSQAAPRNKQQLRNHAKLDLDKEAQILVEVLAKANQDGIVAVPPLKTLLEKKLGKSLCLTTVYNMLRRHGWRKPTTNAQSGGSEKNAAAVWHKES